LTNRQGSAETIDLKVGNTLSTREAELHAFAREVYDERLEAGVAREQARKDLPLSTYPEAYWKTDLHNLLHFLSLRMDQHAQFEIRSYANIIGDEIVSKWCPIAWEAFLDYRLYGGAFSKLELAILKEIVANRTNEARQIANSLRWLVSDKKGWKRNREREEFEAKLTELGLPTPW
jgi:thymidylate synthase (FAD)